MRTSSSTQYHIEQARLIFAILFLLSCPAYAQVANKRLLLVSVPDHQLALIEDGEVKKVYAVATGRESSPSPTGSFHIVARLTDPTYYHPGRVIGPGPGNPLGSRWMGLDRKGYGIHGTNAPGSIGKSASHGCIRMAKRDLEDLFARVKVGDAVEIRGERDAETAAIFGGPATETVVAKNVQAGSEPAGERGGE